jgi:hypothetical protein
MERRLWVQLRDEIVQLTKLKWDMVRDGMWRRTCPMKARETQT